MPSSPLKPWFVDLFLWVAMVVVGTTLTLLSLARYWGYNAGMLDLGNMAQAIWSVTQGQPLVFTQPTGAYSRLTGHVEFFYLLFVPFVAIWPNPQPLLTGQALLAAAGAIPAYRLAMRQLDSRLAARCIALIYLLYPVMQTAVLFDFHGDTLAMPLLLFALDAADRKAWRSYSIWLALALSCKVYVAAPVAGIGAYLWLWGGERRVGTWTMVAAVVYGAVVFFGVRELFAAPAAEQSAAVSYVSHYYGNMHEIWRTLPERLGNALVVFGPALFLAWRGWRWLLPAAPLTLAVLLSTGPGGVYHYGYHHYALVVPFIVRALIEAAARLRQAAAQASAGRVVRRWQPDLIFTSIIVLLCMALLVDQPLNPLFWLAPPGYGRDHAVYGSIERDGVKDRFLAEHVPPKVPIAASMFLAPRLVARETLYVTRYSDDPGGERLPRLLPQVDYVLADGLFDWRQVIDGAVVGGAAYEQAELGILLRDPAFGLVAARDGLLLFQRDAPPATRLAQQVELVDGAEGAEAIAQLGPLALVAAEVRHLEGRRYRASFTWRLEGAAPARNWFAVSQLGSRSDARMLHLPTFALQPVSTWQRGQVVREQFELNLPDDIPAGTHPWYVAWYDPAHPEAALGDPRARVGGSESVLVQELLVGKN